MAAQAVVASLCDNVRTGDLVFFNQRCDSLLGAPAFASICAFRKYGLSQSGRGLLDHAAVIVRNPRTGVPWLLEGSVRAVRLVPFEERAMEAATTSTEVVLVRLRAERTPELEARAQGFLGALALDSGRAERPIATPLAQMWRVYAPGDSRGPVPAPASDEPRFGARLVASFYEHVGLISAEDSLRAWTPLGLRSDAFSRCLRGGARLQGEIHVHQ